MAAIGQRSKPDPPGEQRLKILVWIGMAVVAEEQRLILSQNPSKEQINSISTS
jgi:hypothetical protein